MLVMLIYSPDVTGYPFLEPPLAWLRYDGAEGKNDFERLRLTIFLRFIGFHMWPINFQAFYALYSHCQ